MAKDAQSIRRSGSLEYAWSSQTLQASAASNQYTIKEQCTIQGLYKDLQTPDWEQSALTTNEINKIWSMLGKDIDALQILFGTKPYSHTAFRVDGIPVVAQASQSPKHSETLKSLNVS